MAMLDAATARSVFVAGLRDAHAVENQALALIDRQLDRLENYPEVADMLRAHRIETEGQITRLEEILTGLDESHSGLKDLGLTISGNMAALAHSVAPDEIIKNSFANHAFEHFEIAAYTGLIALADGGGFGKATPLLQQTLGEEQRMAQLVLDSIPMITTKYVELRAAGEQASR